MTVQRAPVRFLRRNQAGGPVRVDHGCSQVCPGPPDRVSLRESDAPGFRSFRGCDSGRFPATESSIPSRGSPGLVAPPVTTACRRWHLSAARRVCTLHFIMSVPGDKPPPHLCKFLAFFQRIGATGDAPGGIHRRPRKCRAGRPEDVWSIMTWCYALGSDP